MILYVFFLGYNTCIRENIGYEKIQLKYFPIKIALYIIIIFGIMVYHEIIIVYVFGMNYNTKDDIRKRACLDMLSDGDSGEGSNDDGKGIH